jgi:hypothetical protein
MNFAMELIAALGTLDGWYLVLPLVWSPFTDPDLRFKFLVRRQISEKWVVRDKGWSGKKKLPISMYWTGFAIWYLILTLEGFLIVYLVAFFYWKLKATNEPQFELYTGLRILAIQLIAIAFLWSLMKLLD